MRRLSNKRRNRSAKIIFAAVAGTAIMPSLASAAAGTWTGLGTDNKWTNNANWSGASFPTLSQGAALAGTTQTNIYFDGGAGYNDTVSISRGTTGTASNFVISGNTISIVAANSDYVAGSLTFNNSVVAKQEKIDVRNYRQTAPQVSTVTFAGGILYNTAQTVAVNLSLSINVGGNHTFQPSTAGDIIFSGADTFVGTVIKAGQQRLSFQGSNAGYSGSSSKLTIYAGTVDLASATNGGIGAGLITLGNSAGFTPGTLNAAGADRSLTNSVSIVGTSAAVSGFGGTNSLTFSAGTLTGATGSDRLLKNDISGFGKLLTLNDVALNADASEVRTMTITGGGNTTVAGAISNGGAQAHKLTLSGTNATTTLKLNGTNTFTGATLVTKGTLGGVGSLTGSALTVGDGVGSADAILAPGNSIGTISTGSLSFASDAVYDVEVDGAVNGSSDKTVVTGSVNITSGAALNVTMTNALTLGTFYTIIDNDSSDAVSGTFAGLSEGAAVGATGLNIYYGGNSATNAKTGGNDVVLAAVPEPSSLMGLLGAGALMAIRRRKRS